MASKQMTLPSLFYRPVFVWPAFSVVAQPIRPALESVNLPWYGWRAFRRGLASNLYAMGSSGQGGATPLASLEAARHQGTLYKGFDRTLLDAVENVQRRIKELKGAQADRQQLELKFGDDFAVAKSSSDWRFSASLCAQASRVASRVCLIAW